MIKEVKSNVIICDICCAEKTEQRNTFGDNMKLFYWERIHTKDLCFSCYKKLVCSLLSNIEKKVIEDEIIELKECAYRDRFPDLNFDHLMDGITEINKKCNGQ